MKKDNSDLYIDKNILNAFGNLNINDSIKSIDTSYFSDLLKTLSPSINELQNSLNLVQPYLDVIQNTSINNEIQNSMKPSKIDIDTMLNFLKSVNPIYISLLESTSYKSICQYLIQSFQNIELKNLNLLADNISVISHNVIADKTLALDYDNLYNTLTNLIKSIHSDEIYQEQLNKLIKNTTKENSSKHSENNKIDTDLSKKSVQQGCLMILLSILGIIITYLLSVSNANTQAQYHQEVIEAINEVVNAILNTK